MPRVPHEDERARRARSSTCSRRPSRWRRRRWSCTTRASSSASARTLAGVLLFGNTGSWEELDGAHPPGPGHLRRTAARAVSRRRRAGRDGPRRRLRDPAALRPRAGARRVLHRPARGRRRDRARLGRLPATPAAARRRARRTARRRPCRRRSRRSALARVSGSAAEARAIGFLGPDDRITMNRDRLLADARAFALELADGYTPPEPQELRLPGPVRPRRAGARRRRPRPRRPRAAARPGRARRPRKRAGGGDADPTVPSPSSTSTTSSAPPSSPAAHGADPAARRAMLTTGKPLRN